MTEDATRVLPSAKRRKGGHYGECNGGHGQQLEESRVDCSHEVHRVVDEATACQADCRTDGKCATPNNDLSGLFRNVVHAYTILLFITH